MVLSHYTLPLTTHSQNFAPSVKFLVGVFIWISFRDRLPIHHCVIRDAAGWVYPNYHSGGTCHYHDPQCGLHTPHNVGSTFWSFRGCIQTWPTPKYRIN